MKKRINNNFAISTANKSVYIEPMIEDFSINQSNIEKDKIKTVEDIRKYKKK